MPVVPKSASAGTKKHMTAEEIEMAHNNQVVDDADEEKDDMDMSRVPTSLVKLEKKKKKKKRKKKVQTKAKVKKRELLLYFDPKQMLRSDSFNECRLCLDPGVLRACCGNFYCNKCFYRGNLCPSCSADVNALVSASADDTDPSKNQYGFMPLHILVRGLLAKMLVYGVLLGIPVMLLYGFVGEPIETIHGFQCHGIFPSCDLELCTDFHSHVYNNTRWHNRTEGWCKPGQTTHCVCSLACVFDPILYSKTDGRLGADFCTPTFNSWVIANQDHFDRPLYTGLVLDNGRREEQPDTSHRWELIDNGVDMTFCNSWSGNASLVFGGEVVNRKVITAPCDLRYGARVDYRLRYGDDEACLECCRALYSPGTVSMFFSNHYGPWQAIKTYGIHSYKFGKFEFVRETLPAARLSSSVRFMWIQSRFTMHRDWWALDNVTIEAQGLPAGWQQMKSWEKTVAQAQTELMHAQCCFESDLCNLRRTLTRLEREECARSYPGEYDIELPSRFDDGAYTLIGCMFLQLCRWIWEWLQERCLSWKRRKQWCREKCTGKRPTELPSSTDVTPVLSASMVTVVNEEEGDSVVQAGAPTVTGASKYAVVEAPETMPNTEEPFSDTAEEGDSDSSEGAAADDEDKITVSYIDFNGNVDVSWQRRYLLSMFLMIVMTFVTMIDMWTRPGSTGEGVWGNLAMTQTFDYEPTPWVQKNDFVTTKYHKFPYVLEHFSIDLLFPRVILPVIAILLDIDVVYRTAKDVRVDTLLAPYLSWIPRSCFSPRGKLNFRLIHHTSRMLDVEGTMARDRLVIDDLSTDPDEADDRIRPWGVIRLARITSVSGIDNTEIRYLSYILMFTSIPWACLGILSADNTNRAPGLICAILAAVRTLSGHAGFVDIAYAVQQFASWKALRFYMVADQMFQKLCLKTTLICTLSGIAAGGLVILFLWVGTAPTLELWVPIMVVTSGSFMIFGWGLGCSRALPIRHVLKLSSLENGVVIRYKETERCCFDCDCCQNWAVGLCSQEKRAIIFVEDSQELARWLRCAQMLE